jgi:hypothetical protein
MATVETQQATTFKGWLRQVNAHVVKSAGLGIRDLADVDYIEFWESGLEPEEAASIALEENGFYDF